MPGQEAGTRPHRPSIHMPHADVAVNRSAFTVTATMSNAGTVGVSLRSSPTSTCRLGDPVHGRRGHATRPTPGRAARRTGYGYAFSVYGPDGFVRSFAGDDRRRPATTPGQIPGVAATPVTGAAAALRLTLANDGTQRSRLHPHGQRLRGHHPDRDRGRGTAPTTVSWPVERRRLLRRGRSPRTPATASPAATRAGSPDGRTGRRHPAHRRSSGLCILPVLIVMPVISECPYTECHEAASFPH